LLIALGAALALATAAIVLARRGHDEGDDVVTFTRDIAPLVWAKCAPCHRPGEAGPFSLLGYDDVVRRKSQIAKVTRTRYMPPWKPVPGYVHYANDRSLDDAQIALLQRWIDSGAREGDPADLPAMPTWPEGWQLGTPDLVVQMPQTYTVPADGRDVYRNFVLPTGLPASAGTRWVAAWEMRGNGATAIHHAIVNLDKHGWARRRDAEDAEPGFPGMDPGDIQAPDGFYLVWTPGKAPSPPIPGTAWQLDGSTDLVLQLHLQPTGKPQTVQPTIGLYFTPEPPTRPRITIKIGDPYIDIAPGIADYAITDTLELPCDTDVLGLFPHAHYLARKMRVWARRPDDAQRWLLVIDDWDFAWQEEYTLAEPLHLPRGSAITMEFHYDNTAANERNPNQPPRRVTSGERSVDEMGNVTLELAPTDPHDIDALREAKYRRALARDASNPREHYNLANTLAREGRRDDAIAEYRVAVGLAPQLAPASFNLANLLLDAGRIDEAIAAYEAAIKAQPQFPEAELNLGNAVAKRGDKPGAIAHYRKALQLRPGYFEARRALADAGAAP
jgi:TolA-binding protein